MRRLHRISTLAMNGADLPTLLEESLRATMALQGADFGFVQLYDASSRNLHIAVQHGFAPAVLERIAAVADESVGRGPSRAAARHERLVVADTESDAVDPSARMTARSAGYRALQSTPLLTGSGDLLGRIATHFRAPRRFNLRELRLTDLYAQQAASAIQRLRSEAALRDSEERLRLALSASGMGTFIWYVDEDRGEPDASMRRLFGLPPNGGVSLAIAMDRLIHPDDRPRYAAAVERALDPAGDGTLREEIRVQREIHRGERWVAITGRTTFAGVPPRAVRIAGVAADITERKHAEAALRASEQQHAFLLALTDALRPLTDPVEIQAAATRVLGEQMNASRALYGQLDDKSSIVSSDYCAPGIDSMVGTLDGSGFGTVLAGALRGGRTLIVPDVANEPLLSLREREAYASRSVASFVAVPLVKREGNVAFIGVSQSTPRAWTSDEVALVEETGDRTWSAVERAHAEAQLRIAHRRKDEFLATLAHELRNPLAPLRNGLQIARLSIRQDSALQRTVEMMNRQLTHLVRLVDDLLDVGRISSGKLVLRTEPISLAETLATSIETSQAAFDAASLELVVDVCERTLIVAGDRDRLAQVFSNLLANAAKYTDAGGRICVRLAVEGDQAVVRVADTGIGIADADLEHVFDLFSQVRTHQGRGEGGLGIGLSLVKRLVELHGGHVTVSSGGPGKGSEFSVFLPLLRVVEATSAEAVTSMVGLSTELTRRVLVVDDNQDSADTLAALLRLLGHRTWTAHDGPSAIDIAGLNDPEIVFLDLGMPMMSGLEVARHLRASVGGGAMLLVAVTGRGTAADRLSTRDAGFDWHLTKPVDMDRLLAILESTATRH